MKKAMMLCLVFKPRTARMVSADKCNKPQIIAIY